MELATKFATDASAKTEPIALIRPFGSIGMGFGADGDSIEIMLRLERKHWTVADREYARRDRPTAVSSKARRSFVELVQGGPSERKLEQKVSSRKRSSVTDLVW